MKVRVLKKPNGDCIPQYQMESGRFPGSWTEINLEGDFAMHYYDEYYSITSAVSKFLNAGEKFKLKRY